MISFFKAKNMAEATAHIWERLALVPDDLKSSALSAILQYPKGRSGLKKYPMAVKCHFEKPSFHLSDGDCLFGFALKKSGALTVATEIKYMGSSDSVLWHQSEQLSQGQAAPAGQIGIFIVECASHGGNRGWLVDLWIGRGPSLEHSSSALSEPVKN